MLILARPTDIAIAKEAFVLAVSCFNRNVKADVASYVDEEGPFVECSLFWLISKEGPPNEVGIFVSTLSCHRWRPDTASFPFRG